MGKHIIPTKFNKTSKRVLTAPISYEKIFKPISGIYRKAYQSEQKIWLNKLEHAKVAYIDRMSDWIASYVAVDSTSDEERYRIVNFLARQALVDHGPMYPGESSNSKRWSNQIGQISRLAAIEEETWNEYTESSCKADEERASALCEVSSQVKKMKRELLKEVSDYFWNLVGVQKSW